MVDGRSPHLVWGRDRLPASRLVEAVDCDRLSTGDGGGVAPAQGLEEVEHDLQIEGAARVSGGDVEGEGAPLIRSGLR